MDDSIIGVKTGFTDAAGRCLVSAAERNGRRLIAVTVKDRNDWIDHATLLDYGFAAYSLKELARCGQVMDEVPVIGGAEEAVAAVLQEDISYCLAEEEQAELRVNLPAFVYAPILAGDAAGTLSVLVDGAEVKTYPLYWRYSVLEGA